MPSPPARPALVLPTVAPLVPPPDFVSQVATLGLTLTDAMVADLGHYLALLLAMNEQVNLTAITTPDEAWQRHAFDALTLAPKMAHVPAKGRLVDVGSGGGVPAIPLAIVRRDLLINMVESTQKKAVFLRGVCERLKLNRVRVEAERAEVVLKGPLRGAADVVTARAVARLSTLAEWTMPFLKPGGVALLLKGQKADEELAEAEGLLKKLRVVHRETEQTPTGRIVVIERPKPAPPPSQPA